MSIGSSRRIETYASGRCRSRRYFSTASLPESRASSGFCELFRNAFYCVLDRETGKFVAGQPYAKQTWGWRSRRRRPTGRCPDTGPSPEGNLVFPSITGAINWTSDSYSPITKLFNDDAREMGSYFVKGTNT